MGGRVLPQLNWTESGQGQIGSRFHAEGWCKKKRKEKKRNTLQSFRYTTDNKTFHIFTPPQHKGDSVLTQATLQ